jgi:hypothetical protein
LSTFVYENRYCFARHLLGDARIGVARTSTYFEQGCSPKYEEYAKFLQKELKSLGIESKIEIRIVG